jgi:Ni,Fe-hydrogenase I cytochrome b subunit
MWHPAKPLLENRVEFVHCIVIIMHCLLKLFRKNLFYFSKTPHPNSNAKPGRRIILFWPRAFANGPIKQIKIYFVLAGAVERAVPTRTTTPSLKIGPTCPTQNPRAT